VKTQFHKVSGELHQHNVPKLKTGLLKWIPFCTYKTKLRVVPYSASVLKKMMEVTTSELVLEKMRKP